MPKIVRCDVRRMDLLHCGAFTQLSFVLFYFRSSGYRLGRTVAAVSAQRPLEQNITIEWTPHSVFFFNSGIILWFTSGPSSKYEGVALPCPAEDVCVCVFVCAYANV